MICIEVALETRRARGWCIRASVHTVKPMLDGGFITIPSVSSFIVIWTNIFNMKESQVEHIATLCCITPWCSSKANSLAHWLAMQALVISFPFLKVDPPPFALLSLVKTNHDQSLGFVVGLVLVLLLLAYNPSPNPAYVGVSCSWYGEHFYISYMK